MFYDILHSQKYCELKNYLGYEELYQTGIMDRAIMIPKIQESLRELFAEKIEIFNTESKERQEHNKTPECSKKRSSILNLNSLPR